MRIAIDMQGLQAANRNDGFGRYEFLLIQEIVRNRGKHEIFLVLNGLLTDSIETVRASFNDLLSQENILVWEPCPVGSSALSADSWRRRAQEPIREAFLSSLSPDIILVGSLFEGETGNVIVGIGTLNLAIPTAAIIGDLLPPVYRQEYLGNVGSETWYENRLDHLRRPKKTVLRCLDLPQIRWSI